MVSLNSRQYESLVNPRTIITVAIALLATWLVFHFHIKLHQHVMVFSIIISFPLVFALQSAFKRRDRALEFLSLFKAGMAVIYRSVANSKKAGPEVRQEAREVITAATNSMLRCLRDDDRDFSEAFKGIDQIFLFLDRNAHALGSSNSRRVIRYMRDVYESASYLISLKRHHTIRLLRSFAFVVINLFPFIQSSILYSTLGDYYSPWVIYLVSAATAGILITMYNIQLQLEYPFDQIGVDDIHLEDFMFEAEEEQEEPLQMAEEIRREAIPPPVHPVIQTALSDSPEDDDE